MIRHKNRPASIVAPVPPTEARYYKIRTENGLETVPESELQFDTQADINKFNKDYERSISDDSVIAKTNDEQVVSDIKETDKLREEASTEVKKPVEVKKPSEPQTVADVKKK